MRGTKEARGDGTWSGVGDKTPVGAEPLGAFISPQNLYRRQDLI